METRQPPPLDPEVRGACQVVRNPDGWVDIVMSQSWLGSFSLCPESARLDMVDPELTRFESDASFVGVAVHDVLDAIAKMWQQDPEQYEVKIRQAAGTGFSTEVVAMIEERVNPESLSQVMQMKATWMRNGAFNTALAIQDATKWALDGINELGTLIHGMTPDQVLFEQSGTVEFLRGDGFSLWLHGTADILIPDRRMACDWKTGSPKRKWELERGAVQHLVYKAIWPWIRDFKWFYLDAKKAADVEVVVRMTNNDIDRLQLLVEPIVQLILNDPPEVVSAWPRTFDSWKCSEKWCKQHREGKCIGATRVVFPEYAEHQLMITED